MTARLLLDNSAWFRLGHPSLDPRRSEEVAQAMEAREIVVALPLLLEAGYSARTVRDHENVLAELLSLPRATIDASVEMRSLDAQRALVRIGHHRLPPIDILTAALADHHGLGVLHYDGDYDVLAERTDLDFESVWLAERGTL